MHIPDGYLSPQTYVPLYAVFAGFITVALKKVRQTLPAKNIPYLGMAAAFSFLIMMFNIPVREALPGTPSAPRSWRWCSGPGPRWSLSRWPLSYRPFYSAMAASRPSAPTASTWRW